MSGQQSKQAASKSTTRTTVASATLQQKRCRVENYLVIWIDGNIDQSNADCQDTLVQLRAVVNEVNPCMTTAECMEFLEENKGKIAFVISSGTLGQQLVPEIHSIPKLDSIYIFCANKQRHKEWTKNWTKIQGVYTSIKPICEALQPAVKQCNQNTMSVSIIGANEGGSSGNLNQLPPNFMYSQIFKEILLEMEHEASDVTNFASFCKNGEYNGNTTEEIIIDEFARTYQALNAIWWYTRECFTYKMLNAALRTLNGDVIIRMGFFLCDVHRQLEALHKEQVSKYRGKVFTVFRGQGLSTEDIAKLSKNKGGLISFNKFLSSSTNRDVSLGFAEKALGTTDMVGVLFQMSIDPTVSSTPFASIEKMSYFNTEAEILFSMHTVFRIGEVRQLDNKRPLYQVDITLTPDDDKQLLQLTELIREEASGSTGWIRLGTLLYKIGQFDKAEELYLALLLQTSDNNSRAEFYNQLGVLKVGQGQYKAAISFFEKSLKICLKTLPEDHPELAARYNNIGEAYRNIGDSSKALEFYEKANKIWEIALPPNPSKLAISYNNTGLVYDTMREYSKALKFYEKSLKITEAALPPNHPDLATFYNNIGVVYAHMDDYSKACEYFEKSLKIREIALPPNHPDLAISYDNIGRAYENKGDHSKALEFYEKANKIFKIALPLNHPDLAISYDNIGKAYENNDDYSQAVEFYEKSLEIRKIALPSNHPLLATSYNSVGTAYYGKGDYSKSVQYLENALAVTQKSLPATHPNIKQLIDNIDYVKKKM